MKRHKKILIRSYGKFKSKPSAENKKEYKNAQKSFRKIQRRERYLKELSEVSKLDFVAKLKNKNVFWKYTKKLKNKRSVTKEVTASPSKLFDHYKTFFTDDKLDLNSKQQNITNQVNDYFNDYYTITTFRLLNPF